MRLRSSFDDARVNETTAIASAGTSWASSQRTRSSMALDLPVPGPATKSNLRRRDHVPLHPVSLPQPPLERSLWAFPDLFKDSVSAGSSKQTPDIVPQ